ncbi:MAG TPA: hemin uptake protein HemP [Xanthobacteraceae bacterium]|nr:hemin uptake protein HemP [Xanthobacteraceae bacterium]
MIDDGVGGLSSSAAESMKRTVDVIGETIDSRDLFLATKEIVIAHRGQTYRLRLTAQNKLILTK